MSKHDSVALNLNNKTTIPLSTIEATLGNDVIPMQDIAKQNAWVYDPGFKVTAACESKITYIDGNKGILLHRGYPIEELAAKKNFLETAQLLMQGELPQEESSQAFRETILSQMTLDPSVHRLLKGNNGHPMALLISALGQLATLHHDQNDYNQASTREQAAYDLVAKVPCLIAAIFCHQHQQPYDNHLQPEHYAGHFLALLRGRPLTEKEHILAKALDKIFILHADHEQNASTSTVRLAGSTGADPYACVAAGVAALWGKAHGGANEACLDMLETIGSVDHIEDYIAKAKDPNDNFRLMGFGHRVYKSYDPRATIMRSTCHEVLSVVDKGDLPLFKLAMALEKIALEDDYFKSRNLYPNVDFYSGITLSALGIPKRFFTTIFALARTTGWVAHWLEMRNSDYQLGRPRQLYTGPTLRHIDD